MCTGFSQLLVYADDIDNVGQIKRDLTAAFGAIV